MSSSKKRGLGKGLDALLPKGPEMPGGLGGSSAPHIQYVDPREVRPNPWQPRRQMDAERLDDLAQSIKEKGVLQPVLVRRVDDRFEIIAGERRVRAAVQAGLERIPVLVSEMADEGSLEAALIENVQREDLGAMEEAHAYQRLVKEFGLTQETVARRVGKSRVAVANALRLLKLSPEIQSHLEAGTITAGHARAILMCKTSRQESLLVGLIVERGISVREAEDWVRRQNEPKADKDDAGGEAKRRKASPFAADIEEKLMGELGLRVRVKEKAGGKGRLEIYFANGDELERLLGRLGLESTV